MGGRTVHQTQAGCKVHFGLYEDDMINGVGLCMYPNGRIFIGEFWGGLHNGWGNQLEPAGENKNRIMCGEFVMGHGMRLEVVKFARLKLKSAVEKTEVTSLNNKNTKNQSSNLQPKAKGTY